MSLDEFPDQSLNVDSIPLQAYEFPDQSFNVDSMPLQNYHAGSNNNQVISTANNANQGQSINNAQMQPQIIKAVLISNEGELAFNNNIKKIDTKYMVGEGNGVSLKISGSLQYYNLQLWCIREEKRKEGKPVEPAERKYFALNQTNNSQTWHTVTKIQNNDIIRLMDEDSKAHNFLCFILIHTPSNSFPQNYCCLEFARNPNARRPGKATPTRSISLSEHKNQTNHPQESNEITFNLEPEATFRAKKEYYILSLWICNLQWLNANVQVCFDYPQENQQFVFSVRDDWKKDQLSQSQQVEYAYSVDVKRPDFVNDLNKKYEAWVFCSVEGNLIATPELCVAQKFTWVGSELMKEYLESISVDSKKRKRTNPSKEEQEETTTTTTTTTTEKKTSNSNKRQKSRNSNFDSSSLNIQHVLKKSLVGENDELFAHCFDQDLVELKHNISDACDGWKRNLFHWCAAYGLPLTLQASIDSLSEREEFGLLFQYLNCISSDGESPFVLAVKCGNDECAEILKQAESLIKSEIVKNTQIPAFAPTSNVYNHEFRLMSEKMLEMRLQMKKMEKEIERLTKSSSIIQHQPEISSIAPIGETLETSETNKSSIQPTIQSQSQASITTTTTTTSQKRELINPKEELWKVFEQMGLEAEKAKKEEKLDSKTISGLFESALKFANENDLKSESVDRLKRIWGVLILQNQEKEKFSDSTVKQAVDHLEFLAKKEISTTSKKDTENSFYAAYNLAVYQQKVRHVNSKSFWKQAFDLSERTPQLSTSQQHIFTRRQWNSYLTSGDATINSRSGTNDNSNQSTGAEKSNGGSIQG